ncbi:guanylate-binding family protein [Wolffia australiana]
MMQMLGFRGVGSSPSTKDGNPTNSPGTPSPSFSNGPARPLRLVYFDDKGKFQMDPEAVAALHLVKGPIGVVSVCGRARQGKSFILNQLLGRSSGFQVASTHRPCTKGLWMWSAPLKLTALDGTEYSLLLLDSEGIDAYDQTGTYSTQIFSLAVLLSSMFVYNQMGGIDEAALDRLSLVTEMTKHIRVRASSGRSTATELGQYSPVFVWLLRDFYLDLVEDNRRLAPRDYLELALRPVQGGRKDVAAKNEIRESIRALFPDRECFTLVRPLNNESDLQRLHQIPLDKLRPEFRAGLDAFTKFVFERTRPKQVGATVMTGPILAGITQSFLDALNNGAVPTISSSWQSVEETECRKAYEQATEVYMSSFDRSKPPDEAFLREEHDEAFQKAMAAFSACAVGSGQTRQKFEKLFHNFSRKAFEDYKRNSYLEAELGSTETLQVMEKKLRGACHVPDAKIEDVIQLLENLCSDYEKVSHGPGKWQKLATFLLQCLNASILDLFRKQMGRIESEKSDIALKLRSNEDKVALLRKQAESNEKHRAEYMKRYEEAISDKRKVAEDYSVHLANLQSKSSTLEERCLSLSKTLGSLRNESSEWKMKYERSISELKAEEDRHKAEVAALKSRFSAAESRLAASREQAQSAQEEAQEWKRKYDSAVGEAKTSLERAALVQERSSQKARDREDALRAEFLTQLAEKEEEIKQMKSRVNEVDAGSSGLIAKLKVAETLLKNYEMETQDLKKEMITMNEKLEAVSSRAQSYEREARVLEQEKTHLEEKHLSEMKKREEAELRCRTAEAEAKKATGLADDARADAIAAQREKGELQQLAMERLAMLERMERRAEGLERDRAGIEGKLVAAQAAEAAAAAKLGELEAALGKREQEMEEMLSQNNEQRSSTVQVLEGLLESERGARVEASSRAEALSLQLQATQAKLDLLQQELAAARLNEGARTGSHGKRARTEDTDMVDVEAAGDSRKKNKKKKNYYDSGTSFEEAEKEEEEEVDPSKFTVLQLKQELTRHGFGAELLQLRNPVKKDLLSLYQRLVLNNK